MFKRLNLYLIILVAKKQKQFNYIYEKQLINNQYTNIININPKVDSKTQRRVQCSIDITDIPDKFIIYNSIRDTNKPNIIRGIEMELSIYSLSRKRTGITIPQLKELCKQHKIKKYSHFNKQGLIDLLNENNVTV